MNRRRKRLLVGVMVVGLAVILVLAIAHWGTIRDHMEAWHFQLTRKTETIEPDPALVGVPGRLEGCWVLPSRIYRILANHSGQPVVFARAEGI